MLHIREIERNPTTGCASYASLMWASASQQGFNKMKIQLSLHELNLYLKGLFIKKINVEANITIMLTLQPPHEIWLSQKSASANVPRHVIENPTNLSERLVLFPRVRLYAKLLSNAVYPWETDSEFPTFTIPQVLNVSPETHKETFFLCWGSDVLRRQVERISLEPLQIYG